VGHHLRLSTQTMALQVVVVVLALLVGLVAWLYQSRAQLQDQYGERALAIADAVAALPTVAETVQREDAEEKLQPLGEAVREASGMSFVVIADDEGVRQSHPNPSNLGERVSTSPAAPLAGERVIEVDTGTLGRSVRGKAPIEHAGDIVGMVSVGVLEEHVAASFFTDRAPTLLLFLAPALALGVAGSLLLARRIKRLTHGLEPHEIAALLEERQAMLHGIREGVVGVDDQGCLAVVNDEARHLFGLPDDAEGLEPAHIVSEGPLLDLLEGRERADDVVLVIGQRVLVANRMPVEVRGTRVATIVTVRDRTVLETLSQELDNLRNVADALRAQAHEFDNRLHTLAGLIELGHHAEALALITENSVDHQQRSERLAESIRDPTLAALLLTKIATAEERGVTLILTERSSLEVELGEPGPLLTILGNLIDNAVDAAVDAPTGSGRVTVDLWCDHERLGLRVADSGSGVDIRRVEQLFQRGYSSKPNAGDRGLGLALVKQAVMRLEGELEVRNDGGAVFEARVPLRPLLDQTLRDDDTVVRS